MTGVRCLSLTAAVRILIQAFHMGFGMDELPMEEFLSA